MRRSSSLVEQKACSFVKGMAVAVRVGVLGVGKGEVGSVAVRMARSHLIRETGVVLP